MKFRNPPRSLFLVLALILTFVLVTSVLASDETPSGEDVVAGAQLYDKWYAYLKQAAPVGDMPVWARQSTNSRSGEDTWRCVECHGWDYKGVEGAYGSGSHLTGFPNVMKLAEGMGVDEIVGHLNGEKDPAHDFSAYMGDDTLVLLVGFLKFGTIDDTQYIDPVSLQVKDADLQHGEELFSNTCIECHGEDGKTILFRSEGVDESLGSIALRDPWRFLHRTRFGVSGTEMPVGYNLGWTPEDGRDVLAYAQTLPSGGQIIVVRPETMSTPVPPANLGGPATNLWSGILTGLGAFFGAAGYSIFFIGGFVLVGVLVVTLLKKRK